MLGESLITLGEVYTTLCGTISHHLYTYVPLTHTELRVKKTRCSVDKTACASSMYLEFFGVRL